MSDVILVRRTFEAEKYPKGSDERARLNLDAATSEYMHSHKYMVRRPFLMSDGTPHPRQKYLDEFFRTKKEAQDWKDSWEAVADSKVLVAQVIFVNR